MTGLRHADTLSVQGNSILRGIARYREIAMIAAVWEQSD